ncbi:conserved hypothetical protein [Trichinella spiralis]|uniref:hypothetical protein n=1 Tax=Trichinella spiralis TaxID=6334 RepID=UPI0001EFE640|nr:conserved hypothetical protein [Trichinella spiralis]
MQEIYHAVEIKNEINNEEQINAVYNKVEKANKMLMKTRTFKRYFKKIMSPFFGVTVLYFPCEIEQELKLLNTKIFAHILNFNISHLVAVFEYALNSLSKEIQTEQITSKTC